MPRTKTVPLLCPEGTGLGVGLNCQPSQPPGCLHVLRDDFPKVDSLALGQNLSMDVTGTQGALANLALQQESMSKFVCIDTCAHPGAEVASSAGSWRILGTQNPGTQRPCASVPRTDPKLSPADLRLTSCRLPFWPAAGRSSGCGARRSPLLWKTPPPAAKPTHTPRGSRQGRHRGGDITGTGAPPHPTPRISTAPPQPATKERTGGGGAGATRPLPASRAESRSAWG